MLSAGPAYANGADATDVAALASDTGTLTFAPFTLGSTRLTNGAAARQVAFAPGDRRRLAAGVGNADGCFVSSSDDGGKSWGVRARLPDFAHAVHACLGEPPAIAYAPDGRLYAAYAYGKNVGGFSVFGVAVSSSTDDGARWSAPVSGFFGEIPFPFLAGVQLVAAPGGRSVYMALQRIGLDHDIGFVVFLRSPDRGANWSVPKQIASGGLRNFDQPAMAVGADGSIVVVSAFQPSPFSSPPFVYGVQVMASGDRGDTFERTIVARSRSLFFSEPDIAIDHSGSAHLAYLRRSVDGTTRIQTLYRMSNTKPYRSWQAAIIPHQTDPSADDIGMKLAVSAAADSIVHLAWVERRHGQLDKAWHQCRMSETGSEWSSPLAIGIARQPLAIGDIGLAAAGARAVALWTLTKRDEGSPVEVRASRISTLRVGAATPCERIDGAE